MAAVRGVGGLGGTNSEYLEGSSPIQREFLFENFVVSAFPQTLADSGGGGLDPNPSAGRVLGAAEEGIGESGVAPIYPSDGEGVLFSYKFVRTLLALAGKVAVGELVAIEVLMYLPYDRSKTVRGRRGRRPIWTLLGARPVAALTELL